MIGLSDLNPLKWGTHHLTPVVPAPEPEPFPPPDDVPEVDHDKVLIAARLHPVFQEKPVMATAPVVPVVRVSFFAKVKAEIEHLFKNAPSYQQTATATITYVAPLLETIVALADPAAAPAVNALISKVQSALAAAAVVIKDAGPAPTLLTYLDAINTDIAQVEEAAQIKDPATAEKLKAITGTITGEINAIVAEVQAK